MTAPEPIGDPAAVAPNGGLLRMLILAPAPGTPGSIPRIVDDLRRALEEKGCTVALRGWGGQGAAESSLAKVAGRSRDILEVARLLRRERFDVVVVETSHEWRSLGRDLPLVATIRRRTPPLVVHFHGGRSDRLVAPGSRAFKTASWLLFRLVDGVLVLSGEEELEIRAFAPGLPVRTVTNPLRVGADAPAADERVDPEVWTLLFAGRLIPEKGIFDTLEAVALLRGRVPCRLLVAGWGSAADEVSRRVESLGLADQVTLLGHVDAAKLAAVYRSVDLFVFPTYWFEGFPTVVSEAMDAGLPIVTTRTRGVADELESGVHAVFVPPRNPVAIAEATERLIGDGALRRSMAAANRMKVREFAPGPAAARYLRALNEIVEART